MELATSQTPLLPGTSSTYRDLNAPLVLPESSYSKLALRKKDSCPVGLEGGLREWGTGPKCPDSNPLFIHL